MCVYGKWKLDREMICPDAGSRERIASGATEIPGEFLETCKWHEVSFKS